jgi:hypothetical protein
MLWTTPTDTGGQDDEMDMEATGIGAAGELRRCGESAHARRGAADGYAYEYHIADTFDDRIC